MPNYQFCLRWQPYTISSVSAAAPDHPLSNLTLVREPRKTWQAAGTGIGSILVLDQGATAGAVTALFVNGGSVSQLVIDYASSAAGAWTPAPGSPADVLLDERVNRRHKGWLPVTIPAAPSGRFIRTTVLGIDTTISTFASMGALAIVPSAAADLVTLTRNVGRPEYRVVQPETALDFVGGGLDVNAEGDAYVEYALGHPTLVLAGGTLNQLHAIRNARDVILYENFGLTQHAYLGHITDMDPVARAAFVTGTALRFREFA
jgi:hypothetical protein